MQAVAPSENRKYARPETVSIHRSLAQCDRDCGVVTGTAWALPASDLIS